MGVGTRWGLVLLTVGAGVLRFWDLGGHSVWLDETVSIRDSATLQAAVGSFTHPPVPYLSLYVWRMLFGESDAALRSLAALAGTLCIPVVFVTARRAFRSDRVALTAAFLLAVMPHAIWHGREIRHYTIWPLFALLALWSVLAQRDAPVRRSAAVGYWVWTTLAMATHYYTVFYAAAHALAAWCLIGTRPFVKTRDERRRWLLLHAPLIGVALAFVAYRFLSWGKLGVSSAGAFFGNLDRVAWWLATLVFFRPWAFPDPPAQSLRWGAFLAVALLAIAVMMARDRDADRRTLWALTIVLWLPILAIELLPIRSYGRLLTPTLSVVVLWLAYGLWAPLRSWLAQGARLAVAIVLVVKLVPYLGAAYTPEVEPWKTVCRDVEASETPGTVVLVNEPYMKRPFEHCYRGTATVIGFPQVSPRVDLSNVVEFAADYEQVWFVYSHAWKTDRRRDGMRSLLATHEITERYNLGPLLQTYLLRRRES